jgi:hypothetical protein
MFADQNGGLALGDGRGETACLENISHDESLLHRVSLLCVRAYETSVQNVL